MKHNAQWHSATLRAQRDLSPSVREFEIRPERGVRPWSVGSHLDLRVLVDGREEKRSYSLVGLPDAPGADEMPPRFRLAPLLRDVFFQSMAVVIMFGLAFATVLTLLVLPVIYACFHHKDMTPQR